MQEYKVRPTYYKAENAFDVKAENAARAAENFVENNFAMLDYPSLNIEIYVLEDGEWVIYDVEIVAIPTFSARKKKYF